MIRIPRAMVATVLAMLLWQGSVHAQAPVILDDTEAFESLCATSSAERADADDASADADADARTEYLERRRRQAATPLRVVVSSNSLAYRRYDPIGGLLYVPIVRALPVIEGWQVELDAPAVVTIALSEPDALELEARWEVGTARLVLELLPRSFASWDQNVCTRSEGQRIVHGALLGARFEDAVGQELVTYRTPLGREVALLQANDLASYLGGALPSVKVSSLVTIPDESARVRGAAPSDDLSRKARETLADAVERALFGCYVRGLSNNARLQGAMVFVLTPDKQARLLVDSLHDRDATRCAVDRLTRLAANSVELPAGRALRLTAIFRLQDGGTL